MKLRIPQQDITASKPRPKIYIAYKAQTSKYLAYIIYKTLSSDHSYDIFYDRSCMRSIEEWQAMLDYNINTCNIVIIIGERGAFDTLKCGKVKDPFILEIKKGFEKKKIVYYIPIEGYLFWKDKEIPSEVIRRMSSIYKKLSDRHSTPIHFESKILEQFELDLNVLKKHLHEFIEGHFNDYHVYGNQDTRMPMDIYEKQLQLKKSPFGLIEK